MASAVVKTEKPKRCSDHSGLVARIERLREDTMEERKHRETAFSALNNKLDAATKEIGELKVGMAKLLGGIAAVLFLLQVALKFIPSGGG